jgi:4-hydroxybenzoyl-CoA thioesterase
LPTVHLESDFSRPFSYGDDIEVEVRILSVGTSSLSIGYRVFKKGEREPRIVGHNVTVCINMDTFEKIEIPDWFRRKLEMQMGKDEN